MDEHLHVRGFTIVEVTITVGILALISLALVDLIISSDSLLRSQKATVDVIRSASLTMNDIQTYVPQAMQIAASHSFSGTTYTTSSSTLVLQLPSITSTGAIISGQYDYIAFFSTSTGAFRITDAGTGSARPAVTKRLSDTVTAFTFTFGSADVTLSTSTTIDIQTQQRWKKTNATTHLRNQVYLRNSPL